MTEEKSLNFLEEIIENDIASGKNGGKVVTRFPPEPNGFLHIGHVSSICLNFGLAKKYGGKCNLRFDDTNPSTEETEYVEAIKKDLKWLGFDWGQEHYASDYFDQLYKYALDLIYLGLAYVDDSTSEEMAAQKSSAAASPFRDREIQENLRLFEEMRDGVYKDGEKTLRAKIDPENANYILRDPIIYRIKHATHHRTGDKWCIYPMYDFAHGQSDSIEEITHSICTMEFAQHRPLYDWFIENLEIFPSKQYEFARRNLTYTVTSKRKLLELVNGNHVTGWDDPRMPTISGMRRRGYPPEALHRFAAMIGIGKRENMVDLSALESQVKDVLNKTAPRRMAVLDPLKIVITNYPDNQMEEIDSENNPEDPSAGTRKLHFTKNLLIEREDFMADPTKKYFRLSPGKMVRLKSAYIIKCEAFTRDETGKIIEVQCVYIPNSHSGNDTSGLSVKGTIHWLSEPYALLAEVRMYDRLFSAGDPTQDDGDYKQKLNSNSLTVLPMVHIEPSLAKLHPGDTVQFMRKGYFCVDPASTENYIIFNQTVSLKDSWKKYIPDTKITIE